VSFKFLIADSNSKGGSSSKGVHALHHIKQHPAAAPASVT
jgi:hypothetical protein